MPFANTSTLRYSLRRNDGADDQLLQVRLGYSSRLISRSPSAGLPYNILQETPSIPMADALFPLPLRELEDPLLCHAYVVQLLSSFDLLPVTCNPIARKVASFVAQLAAGDYDAKFQLVVDIDYIQMFWMEEQGSSVRVENNVGRGVNVLVEERVVLDEAPPPPARHKFEGFGREELGECSVCYESYDELNLKGGEKEVARIPCGHVYHKNCILTWFQRSNSCPLCRRKLN